MIPRNREVEEAREFGRASNKLKRPAQAGGRASHRRKRQRAHLWIQQAREYA